MKRWLLALLIALLAMTAFSKALALDGGNTRETAVLIKTTEYGQRFNSTAFKGISWFQVVAPSNGTYYITIYATEYSYYGRIYDHKGNQTAEEPIDLNETATFEVQASTNQTLYFSISPFNDNGANKGFAFSVCFDGYHQVSPYPVMTRESTCQGEGENTYFCELCDTPVTTEPIPAKNHLPGPETVIREATCLQTGIYGVICTTCGEVLSSTEIPLADHTPGIYTTAREATCTGDGVRVQYCMVCNATMNTETVAAFGYSYTDWVETIQATKQHAGEKARYCIYCGDTQTAEIPKLPKFLGIF